MNVLTGILLKVASALVFAVMAALVRWVGDTVPVGQVVFYRSAFAIVPVMVIYAWRRQLVAAVRTSRPMGHVLRGLFGVAGMFFSFAALARLPLADVTAIGFASPLITVVLAALLLKERVRIYRWTAVAVGFAGVIVMLLPHLDIGRVAAGTPAQTLGAMLALAGAFTSAASTIQTRRLTPSETNSAIVFYFSVVAALGGLLTLPLGWATLTWPVFFALAGVGFLGGIGHLLLTESYRLAPASVVAPFDYTSILWAFVLGFALFGEIPVPLVFVGAAIITASGLFVIWRERRLGLERVRARTGEPPLRG